MNENYYFLTKDPLYSDRAVYSDLKPLDGGQSLYPMSTVLKTLVYNMNQSFLAVT